MGLEWVWLSGDNWSCKTCKAPAKSPPTNQHRCLPLPNHVRALNGKSIAALDLPQKSSPPGMVSYILVWTTKGSCSSLGCTVKPIVGPMTPELNYGSSHFNGKRIIGQKIITSTMLILKVKDKVEEKGKWPCGVCKKGVGNNSILCHGCKKWIHKRCSGVKGSLRNASQSFICRC